MGILRKLALAGLIAAAAFGCWQAGTLAVREYRNYRAMQEAVTLMWQYLDATVGQRTLPDGTTAPVNRADVLAALAASAAAPTK